MSDVPRPERYHSFQWCPVATRKGEHLVSKPESFLCSGNIAEIRNGKTSPGERDAEPE